MNKKMPPLTYLKLERMKRNLTQEKLAKAIGVTQGYIYQIETLMSVPSEERKSQLEEIFDKSPELLFSEIK